MNMSSRAKPSFRFSKHAGRNTKRLLNGSKVALFCVFLHLITAVAAALAVSSNDEGTQAGTTIFYQSGPNPTYSGTKAIPSSTIATAASKSDYIAAAAAAASSAAFEACKNASKNRVFNQTVILSASLPLIFGFPIIFFIVYLVFKLCNYGVQRQKDIQQLRDRKILYNLDRSMHERTNPFTDPEIVAHTMYASSSGRQMQNDPDALSPYIARSYR